MNEPTPRSPSATEQDLDMAPHLEAARAATSLGRETLERAIRHLGRASAMEREQVVAYDIAHSYSALAVASAAIDHAERCHSLDPDGNDAASRIACVFAADALADLAGRISGREPSLDCPRAWLDAARGFLQEWRQPEAMAGLALAKSDRGLGPDLELARDTFHRFAAERVAPLAEHVHRANTDVPEEIIAGLAELGGFGLSVPEKFGGSATGGEGDYLAMVVATEELSWASLGIGGSLITRPEILTRAIVNFGTGEQKQAWLPKIASGEIMVAVAVTEPDFGSDVAHLTTMAVRDGAGWRVNGVKTWCTFAARADVLMLLARTDPDRTKAHRGLSLFVVEKDRTDGHGFKLSQETDPAGSSGPAANPGRMEGRAIDTIGYRGMHSYEIAFENWWVPDSCLVGGEAGREKGFYAQMQGFENGRLQTAARALGVMQSAYDAALSYAAERVVFGEPIIAYQLTRAKLGRMAAVIQATRQFAYAVARMMAVGEGALEASMVKAYACRQAEWCAREAMQIHGGMGYAEEFPVSRYFVDSRVLSIFEGADETLALKVIARRLAETIGAS